MIGLTDLEKYIFIFNITKENTRIKIYKFPEENGVGVSYEKIRDEIERDVDNPGITATDLQDEIITSNIIKEYRKQVTKRLKVAGYVNILAGYVSSIIQDFESFPRTEFELVEVDIRLVLDENNSNFITYELEPGFYTFKDLSESVFNTLQPEYEKSSNVIVTEFHGISLRTKLVVRDGMTAITFDEKSIFSTILGFTSGWD